MIFLRGFHISQDRIRLYYGKLQLKKRDLANGIGIL